MLMYLNCVQPESILGEWFNKWVDIALKVQLCPGMRATAINEMYGEHG